MRDIFRDAAKGPAIQKRSAWDQVGSDGQDMINGIKDKFGLARVMLVTEQGYFDTGRYYGNKKKG